MKTATPPRKLIVALIPAILAMSTLGGCASGNPAPAGDPGTTAPSPSTSPKPERSATGEILDPTTESLTWENGNRILGDENDGHTPDIASSLTDPSSGWQADYSRMATDGIMTFTSDKSRCQVRTIQVRNQPSELVPGDDRESTLKVLAILIPGKPDLAEKVQAASLGYGMAGNRGVDMLSLTYTSGESYGYTALRTFSKPAVSLKVEALCPTLDTLKATLPEIRNNISINAR